MRRSEAGGKLLRRAGRYLNSGERNVYWALLERSENDDATVPARFAPTLADLAAECGLSSRSVRRYLDHLDHHGWVEYTPGQGRGRRGRFRLVPAQPDTVCTCPKTGHGRPGSQSGKEATSVPVPEQKSGHPCPEGGHPRPEKGDTACAVIAGRTPFSTEGRREGEEGGGVVPGESIAPVCIDCGRAAWSPLNGRCRSCHFDHQSKAS